MSVNYVERTSLVYLFKSAVSSWQPHKSTGTLRHLDLALVHRVNNDLNVRTNYKDGNEERKSIKQCGVCVRIITYSLDLWKVCALVSQFCVDIIDGIAYISSPVLIENSSNRFSLYNTIALVFFATCSLDGIWDNASNLAALFYYGT